MAAPTNRNTRYPVLELLAVFAILAVVYHYMEPLTMLLVTVVFPVTFCHFSRDREPKHRLEPNNRLDPNIPLDPNEPTPSPYFVGNKLSLNVTRTFNDDVPCGNNVQVKILKAYSLPHSQVMIVDILPSPRPSYRFVPHRAFLKMYDRRFALRRTSRGEPRPPNTPANEAALRRFMEEGKAYALYFRIADSEAESKRPLFPEKYGEGVPDSDAKHEAAMHYRMMWQCRNERRAYRELAELQGHHIPHMEAYVKMPMSEGQQTDDKEFMVFGIMVQAIYPSYRLSEIENPQFMRDKMTITDSEKEKWQEMIQSAVASLHAVNMRGVILQQIDLANVLVEVNTNKPWIVGLENVRFREDQAEASSELETLFRDSDEERWKDDMHEAHNARGVGSLALRAVKERWQVELDIQYPEWRIYPMA